MTKKASPTVENRSPTPVDDDTHHPEAEQAESTPANDDYDEFDDGEIQQQTDIQDDDEGFGDDFDDFEEGAEGDDDDFGDFDDGFQQPEDPARSQPAPSAPSLPDPLAHLVSSLSSLHTKPESSPFCLPSNSAQP